MIWHLGLVTVINIQVELRLKSFFKWSDGFQDLKFRSLSFRETLIGTRFLRSKQGEQIVKYN